MIIERIGIYYILIIIYLFWMTLWFHARDERYNIVLSFFFPEILYEELSYEIWYNNSFKHNIVT